MFKCSSKKLNGNFLRLRRLNLSFKGKRSSFRHKRSASIRSLYKSFIKIRTLCSVLLKKTTIKTGLLLDRTTNN